MTEQLSERQTYKIYENALELLRDNGIRLTHKKMRDKLTNEWGDGVKFDGNMVKIKREVVEGSLESAPKLIRLYDFSGKKDYILRNNGETYFAPGSAATHIYDPYSETQKLRTPVTKDFVEFSRVAQGLENIALQSTALVCADVPEKLKDAYRLFICLTNNQKPIITGTFGSKASMELMKQMLITARGSREALAKKPLAIFDICPSSILKWDDSFVDNIFSCSEDLIPVEWVTMPQPGINCPRSLEKATELAVAEALSGFVLSQTVRKGAPTIFGCSPMGPDLKHATPLLGDIATLKMAGAISQIAQFLYLGFPTHAYLGAGGGFNLDYQAGAETARSADFAIASGINIVSGPGMFGQEECQCLPKLVLDNEVCGDAFLLNTPIEEEKELSKRLGEIRTDANMMDFADVALERISRNGFSDNKLRETRSISVVVRDGEINLLYRVYQEIERLRNTWQPFIDKARATKLTKIMNAALEQEEAKLPEEAIPETFFLK